MDGYPGATIKPLLPEADTNPSIRPTQVILHTIAGSAESALRTFQKGNFESHFIVRLSGEVWQLIPTSRSADANYHANRRPDGTGAISIETEDDGPTTVEDTPWSEEQLESIAAVTAWACQKYAIPPRQCETPDAPGIGYHTLFGAPSEWTPRRKTCPGRVRKTQFGEILTRVQRILSLPVDHPEGDWLDEVLMSLPILRRNETGPFVLRLQALLVAAGHLITIDGSFGPATAAALAAFQASRGLPQDSTVTSQVWRELLTG